VPVPRYFEGDLTVRRTGYNPIEHFFNFWLGVAHKVGFKWGVPRTELVLAEAKKHTGLTDWGNEDFMAGLDQLMSAIAQADYTPLGRLFVRGMPRRAVEGRLRLEAWFKAHPEAEEIEITKPVFVLGFPRTGTTALQNLLDCAPQRRALQFWELTSPIPVHEDREIDKRKRIKRMARDLYWANKAVPELPELHYVEPTTPEECWSLFMNTMMVLNMDMSQGLRPFGDWLLQQDMTWAYREYKRILKMLLYVQPAEQLVLKCPEHLWFIPALLEVFPDACIVQTHRDPLDCIASYCSMVSLSRRTFCGHIDPLPLGEHITTRFAQGVERAMDARDQLGDDRFMDVDFHDLVSDQVAMVHKIEDRFDLARTDAPLLQAWLDNKRADSRGKHRYSAALYGLGPDVYDHFERYIARYDVKLKPPESGK